MTNQNGEARSSKKPQLTDADKALLEAEPDWERMGQAAKRLLQDAPKRAGDGSRNGVAKEGNRS